MNGTEPYENGILIIDDAYKSVLNQREGEKLKKIIESFVISYIRNKDNMSVEEWLSMEMKNQLPETSEKNIQAMSHEIIENLEVSEEKYTSLAKTAKQGRSKENWFAGEVKKATSAMSAQEALQYLQNLDDALLKANNSLYRTITTQSGNINMNPRLDGFIAEQYHAQTFNLNAEATGSPYRAKVLEPNGSGYAKNSVDIVIVDGNGKVVRRYQSKYCKDADATKSAFEHGDYRGQRKLVPEGQADDIARSTEVLEAPDGTKSNPLSKADAERKRKEAQSGNWNELNWNEYRLKDLVVGIGKQAGYAALQGAVIGVGFDIAQKVCTGEKIEGDELIKTALSSGADFGVKAATAGALKVAVEKNIIRSIPKGTPASTFANIAFVGIENVKIFGKMMSGKYTFKEGIEQIERTTIATIAGLAVSAKGKEIGETTGAVFGPIGKIVGGFIGGTVGYMAGAKVGEEVVVCSQKIGESARKIVNIIGEKALEKADSLFSSLENRMRNVVW